jgi:hypothetical protein
VEGLKFDLEQGLKPGHKGLLPENVERLTRERNQWEDTAAQMCRNMEYYRGLVDQVGRLLGDAAYIADDGSRSDDILRAKVPELVEARLKAMVTQSPLPKSS